MKQTLLSHDGQVGQVSRLVMLMAFLALQQTALAQLTATITSTTNVTCNGGNDGAISIDVSGGVAPYTYDWSHGATTEDVSGLAAGSYSVTVTDALLNTATAAGTLSEPAALTASKIVKDVSCKGGSDGSMLVSVSGGTSPYSYSWSTGDVTADITNRPSGSYEVTITDNKGCSLLVKDTIGEPSEFLLVNPSVSHVSCYGGSDGSISIMPVGGILPYTFIWSNGATTQNLTGIPAGTYSVIGADNNGCKYYDTLTVTEPAQPVSATLNLTHSTCYHSTDGAVDITVSGGVPPYTYAWSTGATTQDLLAVSVGKYSVTITDASGCSLNLDPEILAIDSIPPVAQCQNLNVYLNATGAATITAADLDNGSGDNCSIDTIILDNYAFGCNDLGANSIEFIVYDSNGNSDTCLATVTVFDTVSPDIAVQDYTVYLDAGGEARVAVMDFENGTGDACGIDTLFLDRYEFGCADIGVQSILFTAVDFNGNQASTTVSLTVIDTIKPIAVAQDLSVYLDVNGQAAITAAQIDNGSSDVCGIDTLLLDRYNFTCADLGTQNISFTAVDFGGNSDQVGSNITVLDTLAPVINAQDISAYLDATGNVSIAASDLLVSVDDACGMDTILLDTYDFTCAAVGANPVQITATDLQGNVALKNVVVMVIDTLAPDVQAVDFDLYLDANGLASVTVANVDAGSSTPCGIDTLYLDTYDFTCAEVGVNKVVLTGVSVNGNVSTDTVSINVIDSIKPSVVSQNISIYLDAAGQASIAAEEVDNGSSDECGTDTLVVDRYDFTCEETGLNIINLTVVDVNGNSSSASANVDVIDTIHPVLNTQDISIYLDEMGEAAIQAAELVANISDNCLVDTILLDKYNFDCIDTGANTIQVSALDPSGNLALGTAVVTVKDTINPVVLAQDISVYLDANGEVSVTAADVDAGSGTACGMDTLFLDRYDFDCSHLGTNPVVLTAVKPNGNFTSDTALISVIDTLGPNLNPMDITVYLNSGGNASITVADIDSAVADPCGLDSAALDITNFGCADVGTNIVTLSAWDIYGNLSSVTATVSVMDTLAPAFSTNDHSVYLNAAGQAGISASDVSTLAGDVCGMDTVLLDLYDFGCSEIGANTVTVTAIDINGNAESQQVEVTVTDTIDPTVTAIDRNIYLNADGEATITVADVLGSASDACGIDTLTLDQYDLDFLDLGSKTVVLTAEDASGNTASASATLSTYDTVAPAIITQNVDIYLDTSGSVSIYSLDVDLYLHEACGLDTLYFSKEMFTCADLGINGVTVTAIDASGNRRDDSLTITVRDTTPPNLVNQNLTVYLDANGEASITAADVNQLTTDVCGIDTIYIDRYNFTCAEIGTNTVTLTAIDLNGTLATAPAIVTVVDTVQPIVKARNLTVYLDQTGVAAISVADVDNGSFDSNCSYNLSISDSIFDCGEAGLNLETLTITDGSGNLQSVDFFVTVLDTIRPQPLLRDFTLVLNANGTAVINAEQLDSASTDNCTNFLHFGANKTQFDCSDIGVNSVAVTITDNKLNSITANVNVTVVDAAAPAVATRDTTIYLDANGLATALPPYINNGTTDNCGMDSLWLSKSTFSGTDLGQNTVQLFAKDLGGNISSGTGIITVMDTMKPVISAQTIDIYLDANGQAVFDALATAAASDNHGISAMNVSRTNFGCADLGSNSLSVSAVDYSGNSSNATLTVNVMDSLAPNVEVRDITVYLSATGTAGITTADVDNNSSDNCGIASMSLSQSSFGCADKGTNTVNLTAVDAGGNTSVSSLVVTVLDTVSPVIANVPADISVASRDNACGALVNFSMPTITDNCGNPSFGSSHLPGSNFPVGTTTVKFTVQDGSGNTVSASFDVTVTDETAPVVTAMPANDTVGACEAFYHFAMPAAMDHCSNVDVVQTAGIPSGAYYPVGATTNSFRLSDANGNDTVVSFTVVVEPLGQPVLPNMLSLCENDDPVDFALGQNMQWSGKGFQGPTTFDPAAAGVGYHQLNYNFIDDNGCATSGSIAITVAPQPVEPVITREGSTTLTTGAYDTYQWYRDGVAIPGATSQSLSYTVGGNYQVVVSNTASCENHSAGYVIGKSSGGIGIEENLLSNLHIYPNPTSGIITVDLNNLSREELEVSLYSITGKKLLSKTDFTQTDGKMRLDLGHLPKATYVLHINSDSEVAVRQIVLY